MAVIRSTARAARELRRFITSPFARNSSQVAPPVVAQAACSRGRQTDLSGLGPRRFYEKVDVERLLNRWYAVTVDGKTVKTACQSILATPSEGLSLALAEEWDAQLGRIRPASMPLTRLVSTALDGVPEFRGRIVEEILKYAETDTICFRAGHPESLVNAQDKLLNAVVQWMEERFGVVMTVVKGDLVAPRGVQGVEALRKWIEELDDFKLAAVESATACGKSVAIAAAMCEGRLQPISAFEAARSEEIWQEKVWGSVEGGQDLDSADVLVRLYSADLIFKFATFSRGTGFPKSSRP